MNWKFHYTGIDVAEYDPIGSAGQYRHLNLYVQRDTKTKVLQFVRISGYHWMLGAFLRRTNHLCSVPGWEVFTSDIHFGWLAKYKYRSRAVTWSGSSVDPRHTYSIRIGRFFFGSTTDKWLKKIIDHSKQKKWAIEGDDDRR